MGVRRVVEFSSVVCGGGRARHLTLDAWNPDGVLEGVSALPPRLSAVVSSPLTLCGREPTKPAPGAKASCGLCDTLRCEVVLAAYEGLCLMVKAAPSMVAARYASGGVSDTVHPTVTAFEMAAKRTLLVQDGAVSSLALELPQVMSRLAGSAS